MNDNVIPFVNKNDREAKQHFAKIIDLCSEVAVLRESRQEDENFWDLLKEHAEWAADGSDAIYMLAIYDQREAVWEWAKKCRPDSKSLSAALWMICDCPVFKNTLVRKIALAEKRLRAMREQEAARRIYVWTEVVKRTDIL